MASFVRLTRRGRGNMGIPRILVWIALCGLGAQALGHTRLTSSRPADGQAMAAETNSVILEFSAPVQPRFSDFALHYLGTVRETAPVADTRLPRRSATFDDSRRHVEVPLPESPRSGWYALDWEVIADDGHRIEGTLRFQIAR